MASECILIIDEDKEFLATALDFLTVQMNLNNAHVGQLLLKRLRKR